MPEGEFLAGRYALGALLGRGGTADVYRGTDTRLGRPVAVKKFRPGSAALSQRRFYAEALLLARLEHPRLVRVYDAGQDGQGAFLVTQLIEGVTLRERTADGPLPSDLAIHLCVRLASALAYVHAAGIVHRDVKPSNVLLDAADEPFLTDFGISRFIDEPTRTEPGTVLGTAAYMAPEQVLGKGSGPACDIYALGLVLLECLTGEREYQGRPTEAGVARLLRPPEPAGRVPEALVPVIRAMTADDPAARPDAEECGLLLAAAAAAPPPSAPPKVSGRRRRRTAVAVAALVLGTTGAVTAMLAHDPDGEDAVRHSPAATSSTPATTAPAASPVQAPAPSRTDRTAGSPGPGRAVGPAAPGSRNPGPAQEQAQTQGGSEDNGKAKKDHKKAEKAAKPEK